MTKYEAWMRVTKDHYLGEVEANNREDADNQFQNILERDAIDWERAEEETEVIIEESE